MQIDSERIKDFGFQSLWNSVNPFHSKGTLIPVLRLTGTIGAAMPLRQGLTISACAGAIERAFSIKNAPAVAIQINSPGGSPVQSRLIYERIRALATEKSRKVFAFAEDVAASGGYMLACAADEIYADASSLVGSIGVVSAGFGLRILSTRSESSGAFIPPARTNFSLTPSSQKIPKKSQGLKEFRRSSTRILSHL